MCQEDWWWIVVVVLIQFSPLLHGLMASPWFTAYVCARAHTCKGLEGRGLYPVFPVFVPQLVFETGSLMDLEPAAELQAFLCLCPWHCGTRFHLGVGDQAEGVIRAWVMGALPTAPISPASRNA